MGLSWRSPILCTTWKLALLKFLHSLLQQPRHPIGVREIAALMNMNAREIGTRTRPNKSLIIVSQTKFLQCIQTHININRCPLKPVCDESTGYIPCYQGSALDYYGCPELEYCFKGKFCPVHCNLSTEYNCPGQWKIEDGKWIEQLTPDFCQPRKVEIAGIGECENYCDYQIACVEGMKLCSDMIDPYQKNPDGSLKGCKLHPWCMPADEECPEIFSF